MSRTIQPFKLGRTVMTCGVRDLAERGLLNPAAILDRHASGDWGDLSVGDKSLNDDAVLTGEDRILSAYQVGACRVYVVTEWDRSVTTVMLQTEY